MRLSQPRPLSGRNTARTVYSRRTSETGGKNLGQPDHSMEFDYGRVEGRRRRPHRPEAGLIGDLGLLQKGHVAANGVDFRVLQAGDHGPLALCLHGFPDSAYTWHENLPALAERGYRAVAPFMRGYAPTGLVPDARYHVSALTDDAIALHEALGGDERAVIIGHDWGADAAYGAGALAPARWR